MKQLTVQELINELLAGIVEGTIDANTKVYVPDLFAIKSATEIAISKVNKTHRVIIGGE